MRVCTHCKAIHDGRKWFYDGKLFSKLIENKKAETTLCETCKRVRDRIICGIVYLEGDIIEKNRDEIMRMIKREEAIERSHNHLSRILDIIQDKNRIMIQTINQRLAIHIGKQMKKRFKGSSLEISGGISGHRSRGKDDREEVVVRWKYKGGE